MIEVIAGPMYSGKTEELIRRLTRARLGRKRVAVYKPTLDDRYGLQTISSHSGSEMVCESVHPELRMFTCQDVEVVGFDEAQFFDPVLIKYVQELADDNIKVILAGLDMTYRKEPFGPMPTLLALAANVTKLKAVCHVCGDDAAYTQRLLNGRPASFNGPTIQVGAFESYEARCFYCFEVA